MVISTHGHKEIETNKPKMSNVFELIILNLMWMLSFGFKWPLLLNDSFPRTSVVRAVGLLSSSSLQSCCIYQLRCGNQLLVWSWCSSLKRKGCFILLLLVSLNFPCFTLHCDGQNLRWDAYSKFSYFFVCLARTDLDT